MKTLLEFGRRGEAVSRVVLPTAKTGQSMAIAVAHVLTNAPYGSLQTRPSTWLVDKTNPRVTWQNATHFISLCILPDAFAEAPLQTGKIVSESVAPLLYHLWRVPTTEDSADEI